MKEYALWMGVLAVLAIASCTKETEAKMPEVGKQIEFHAVWADDPGTRTVLQSDGTSVWWTPGEEINAFYGNMFSGKFTSTNTTDHALATFQGTLTVLTGTVETGNEAAAYWAVYPYNAANTCDGQSVTLTVPDVQTAKEGSFADKFFPSVAISKSLDLAFYNVCGGARFSVSQEGIQSITFKSNNGEALVGKVMVGFGSEGYPVVKNVINGKSEMTVTAPSGGFVPGRYYFATFLPQTLSKGLSMTFRTSSHYAVYSSENSIIVNRSRFGKLDEKDKGLTFNLSHVESVSIDKTSLEIGIGMTRTLNATVLPENASDKSVSWSSSDESIATVSSTGVVMGVAVGSAIITVITNEGGKTATCIVTVSESTVHVPEAVDLGLSVKWSSFNLGATKPEESGDYYAWGEIEPYYSCLDPLIWKEGKESGYSWASYKWCMGDNKTLTKYCSNWSVGYNGFTDTKIVLDPEDDAAYMVLGGKWRMPTDAELTELRKNCTWEWILMNGITGQKVTGPNGNSVFLPAAGYASAENIWYGGVGYLWSSSLYTVGAPCYSYQIYYNAYNAYRRDEKRCYGLTIRPVCDK